MSSISISELANQYIIFINQYTDLNIEIAADYLVMASWLTYLKSKLLLPKEEINDNHLNNLYENKLQEYFHIAQNKFYNNANYQFFI